MSRGACATPLFAAPTIKGQSVLCGNSFLGKRGGGNPSYLQNPTALERFVEHKPEPGMAYWRTTVQLQP